MSYFLGIDSSTTGVKALLIDEQGRVVGTATTELPISTPKPLWSEQDPVDWWNADCHQYYGSGAPNFCGFGLHVRINHGEYRTWYAHLSATAFDLGVANRQVIAGANWVVSGGVDGRGRNH